MTSPVQDYVSVPVGPLDTAQTLTARYTIGGASYAPALLTYNAAVGAQEGEVGVDVPLQSLGFYSVIIPTDWLRPGAQVGAGGGGAGAALSATVGGVPLWVWVAGIAILALR